MEKNVFYITLLFITQAYIHFAILDPNPEVRGTVPHRGPQSQMCHKPHLRGSPLGSRRSYPSASARWSPRFRSSAVSRTAGLQKGRRGHGRGQGCLPYTSAFTLAPTFWSNVPFSRGDAGSGGSLPWSRRVWELWAAQDWAVKI